jgi:hypothetical protein
MSIHVWFEQGTVWNLDPETHEGFRQMLRHANEDVYITSGREGDHHPASLHYLGRAWDMRHCGFTKAKLLSALPGMDTVWDVVEYSWGFHVERDPK